MKRSLWFTVLFGVVFVASCSGGSSVLTPARPQTPPASLHPSATPTATPTSTATPSSNATLLPIATVSASLGSVTSYYATLPHTNIVSDLQTLANHMVSSGTFKSAIVSPGGITGRLPDGELTLVYADAPEDVLPATTAASQRARLTLRPDYVLSFTGPPAPHSYIFLFDDADGNFHPNIDAVWGHAMAGQPFTNALTKQPIDNYSTSAVSVSLANIAGFGSAGYGVDYLNLSTHGMVANVAPSASASASPQYQYFLQSTTPMSQRNTYLPDIMAGNVALALTLVNGPAGGTTEPGLAFTPTWLVSKLQLNPGAVVSLNACFGASPLVLGANGVVFENAKVGRWFGWTKAVGIDNFYESWSFALDRLIGEQNPSNIDMFQVALQRKPVQRPFPLDDVYAAMQTETRAGPLWTPQPEPYALSDVHDPENAAFPPASDGTAARLIQTDFGYQFLAGAPVAYAMPSIATMSVAETPTNGTLTINGRFPPDTGSVGITDSSGQTELPVVSWTTTSITATIPASGKASAGNVQVYSGTSLAGVASNNAPLTQWTGTINYQENDQLNNLDGMDGSGQGTYAATFNLVFRSDVHPTVQQIDSSPSPQNLTFANVEGGSVADGSSASVTSIGGTFTSAEGTPPPATATFSLSGTPQLTPANQPLAQGNFIVGAYPGQPAPCNDSNPGPENDTTTVFCPGFGAFPPFVGVCTQDPDDSGLCGDNFTFSPVASFGGTGLVDPGIVTFTMDPSTYAIAVNGPDTQFTRPFSGDGNWPADATVTGTINAPAYQPDSTTPAIRRAGKARVHI